VLDLEQIGDGVRAAIRRNRPTVILISCETAKIKDTESFAKKLLDMGAKGVIAPDSEIGAKSTSKLLESLLEYSKQGDNLFKALRKALQDMLYDRLHNKRFRLIIGRRLVPYRTIS